MSEDIQYLPTSAAGDPRERLTGERFYDASKNPDGATLPGVPLRDLSAEEFEALPLWLQYSIDASAMYRKTKPRASAPAAPAENTAP